MEEQNYLIRKVRSNNKKSRIVSVGELFQEGTYVIIKQINIGGLEVIPTKDQLPTTPTSVTCQG